MTDRATIHPHLMVWAHDAWPSEADYGFCPNKRGFAADHAVTDTIEACPIAAESGYTPLGRRFFGIAFFAKLVTLPRRRASNRVVANMGEVTVNEMR